VARIVVEVCRDGDGEDLLRELAARGLSGRIFHEDGVCKTVEVGYTLDEQERLTAEVESALESWIAQQDMPLVPTLVDGGKFVVRPAAD
jgi:hypothetical protein